ncbi:MAG: hypothetical protein IKV45_00735 [Firmicutes bacterium]|nr:hypothetical protein [Bacillota bacterium]
MKCFKMKKNSALTRILVLSLCLCFLMGLCSVGISAAADSYQLSTYIDKTYEYEKGTSSKVLTDTEAKKALTESVDLLMLAAGRDTGRGAVTDDEFSTYLGYVNGNLRYGNGSYTALDFLRAAVAVGACGCDPAFVGNDDNKNRVDLLYKGVYSRSLTSLEKAGTKTVAYALLALNVNNVSDSEMRSNGSKVTRMELKESLLASARDLSGQAVPDAGTSALILSALSPYYLDGETDVVAVAESLLVKLAGLQSSDGSIKDSTSATADLIVALCSMGIDPATNEFFTYDLHEGLMKYYNNDGGFAPGASSANSSAAATAAARCALVAYSCFDTDGLFFDFSSVKAHSVKQVSVEKPSTGNTTNKNNNSTTNKNNSGSTSNKNSSTSNKNSSSSTTSKNNSSSNSTSTIEKQNSGSSTATGTTAGENARTLSASSNTVTKDKFESIKGTDEVYLYEGTWGEGESYTLSFNGKDITNPMDFNPDISNVVNHQLEIDAAAGDVAEYINFHHTGDFPGKAAATITVSLTDGSYNCYHYNEETATFDAIGSVTVANSMVSFDVTTGGEYFITNTTAQVSMDDLEMALGDTVDGIVPASTFEDIMGKNTDLVLSGETDRGVRYQIVFNGMDVTTPLDFNMRIVEETSNWEDISKLAEGPLVLNFMHNGVLPGPAEITFFANLDASVNYGLFYFNPAEKCGVYSGAIEVGEGEFTFMLNHCSEYFIAAYTGEDLLTGADYTWLIILIIVAVLLIGLGVAGFILYRRWGKEGFVQRINDLKAKLFSKKGAKVEAPLADEALADNETEDLTENDFDEESLYRELVGEDVYREESLNAEILSDETVSDIPEEEAPAEPMEEVAEEVSVEIDNESFMRPVEDETTKD